jgi:tetratricopeptide (TPR) repeat protein
LAGDDRNFIVLDVAAEDSWRAVSREFAHLLLNFNYPPTQDWFDEGFAQYFSSLRLSDNQAQIGGDPAQNVPWDRAAPGQSSTASKQPASLVELLNGPWLAMPELFAMRQGPSGYPPMFYAQSWIVMHYLLNKNKLSDAGGYFGLVEIKKVPVEQAIQQAFGMSAGELESAVKEYFHSLSLTQAPANNKPVDAKTGQAYQSLHPPAAGDVGSSIKDVPDAQGRALVAEAAVRLPEHREQAEQDLRAIIADPNPKMDNAIAHRALAWVRMEKKEFDQAAEELARASELDGRDPWVHYYLALVKYRAAQSSHQPILGVSNMIQDLVAVVDFDPDFAEAHHMLAVARLQGGGVHSATESIRVAIQLSPRNEQYLLDLARIDLAGKKWDDATVLLDRLKNSLNPEIAQAARKHLDDLPTLKKYGVLPQESASSKAAPENTAKDAGETADSDRSAAAPEEPVLDKRKVQFVKGKLVSVDCSQGPAATLTVRTGTRVMKFRTDNYKSLLMVGDEFSCEWRDRAVVVNFKAGGKADGDLVSVEVQ